MEARKTREISLHLSIEDYNMIAKEARKRLLKPNSFARLCIAEYLNRA